METEILACNSSMGMKVSSREQLFTGVNVSCNCHSLDLLIPYVEIWLPRVKMIVNEKSLILLSLF